MDKELAKSLGDNLKERLSSPFLGTLTIVEIGWNYKFFLTIFSGKTLEDKTSYIDTVLYPDALDHFNQFVSWPILITLAAITLYPSFALLTFRIWKNLEIRQKRLAVQLDLQTVITKEESFSLRSDLDKAETRVAELESELVTANRQIKDNAKIIAEKSRQIKEAIPEELAKKIEMAHNANRDLDNVNQSVNGENRVLKENAASLEKKLMHAQATDKERVNEINRLINVKSNLETRLKLHEKPMSEVEAVMEKMAYKILNRLSEDNVPRTTSFILSLAGNTPLESQSAFDYLIEKGFITLIGSAGYKTTAAGRKFLMARREMPGFQKSE